MRIPASLLSSRSEVFPIFQRDQAMPIDGSRSQCMSKMQVEIQMRVEEKIEKLITNFLQNTIIPNRKFLDDEQLDRIEQFQTSLSG